VAKPFGRSRLSGSDPGRMWARTSWIHRRRPSRLGQRRGAGPGRERRRWVRAEEFELSQVGVQSRRQSATTRHQRGLESMMKQYSRALAWSAATPASPG